MGAKENISSYYKSKRAAPKKKAKENMVTKVSSLPNNINFTAAWSSYNLEQSKCELHIPPKPKTRNCADNPYCIHRIGLEKWQKVKPKKSEETSSKLSRRDDEKQPCGLVNFGNYCYVNSFLQIWFNDLVFRQCVYDWRSSPDFQTTAKFDVQAIMNCLQELFVTMQITPYETTNANTLINLLKLDNEQHDVQEFTILFFDAMDRHSAQHPNGEIIRRLIRNRIDGKQKQTVVCTCGKSNVSHNEFRTIPLIIEGCKILNEAFEKSYQDEDLSDYKCDNCQLTGNVKRKTEIVALPPVLLFTLNRYVFDQQGRSKKLTSPLQYPRTLREKFLFPNAAEDRVYELCAVMIHVGQNAHCGHYYDLIKNPISGQWFSYNDTEVKPQKFPPGFVDDPKQTKPSPDTKGCYGLIYRRVDAIGPKSIRDLRLPPVEIYNPIERKLNDQFTRESKEGDKATNVWHSRIEQRADFLEELWEQLEISKGKEMKKFPTDVAFLPTKLLSEIQAKEFKSVEEMKEIHPIFQSDENHNVDDKLAELQKEADGKEELNQEFIDRISRTVDEVASSKKSANRPVENGIDQTKKTSEDDLLIAECLYEREPIEDTQIRLCGHEKISLEAVLKGEIKAVNRTAAENLLEYYGIGLDLRDSNEIIDLTGKNIDDYKLTKLLTGSDICIDCIEQMKTDANFQEDLEKKISIVNEILKEKQRIHDPNRDQPLSEVPPPENSVWCSVKHLASYKRLANQQVEYARSLRVSSKSVYFSRKTPGFKKSVRSSSRTSASTPLISNSIAALSMTENKNDIKRKRSKTEIFNNLPALIKFDKAMSDTEGGPKKKALVDTEDENAASKIEIRKRSVSENGVAQKDESPSKKCRNYSSQDFEDKIPDIKTENGSLLDIVELNEEINMNDSVSSEKIDDKDNLMNGTEEVNKESTPSPKLCPVNFNEDLKCCHGGMTYEVKRIWLHRNEWDELVENIFPLHNLVPSEEAECSSCVDTYIETEKHKKSCSDKLEELNMVIGKLLRNIEKRAYTDDQLGDTYTRILCGSFPSNFIKAYNKTKAKDKIVTSVPEICQDCLLCEDHRKPFRFLEHPYSMPITKDEWGILVDAYRQVIPDQPTPTEIVLLNGGGALDFCDECYALWGIREEEKRYNYPEGANIFVRLKDDVPDEGRPAPERRVTTRRVATKNLFQIKMRSSEKVIDLKLRLYEKTSQYSPIEQLLMKDNVALENDQTLEDAKIVANNRDDPLILIVQQRMDSSNEPRPLEKGFRDTALSY